MDYTIHHLRDAETMPEVVKRVVPVILLYTQLKRDSILARTEISITKFVVGLDNEFVISSAVLSLVSLGSSTDVT